ncbi:aconitate hydratase AcnA [Bradyrhizobium sp. LTSP885]|uniref:aconitate hydratase AcnA n=1 Tax=Bradyrhizobium sp. LTSP885 TaxID=1619232 RepID=UPI001FDA4401|nr:aconitate hydratase AcnA [Bradyrhizobium sp. LTSP885]
MSLPAAEANGAGALSRLPYSLRVLAENLLRGEDGISVDAAQIASLGSWPERGRSEAIVSFLPGRILMQDSAGLPVLADLAALSEAAAELNANADSVAPRLPIDLIVDHAVEADVWGHPDADLSNRRIEIERHAARFRFIKWSQQRFPQMRVAPPGAGICHQLNLEVIADLVRCADLDEGRMAGFDTVIGTDSHTTMINALGVLGWGVGGIEATAALLGEPMSMKIPEVYGVRLSGRIQDGVLATDVALSLTAMLRKHDLVQRFVEFYGPGTASLKVPDRATIANMAPEYGATMGYFAPDALTLDYLARTGRPEDERRRTEAFLRAQNMLRGDSDPEPVYTKVIDFDLSTVERTVAGPSLPSSKLGLADVSRTLPPTNGSSALDHGAVVIASITSCTNTSNPRALVAAGLLAKKACEKGLATASWTKTTFSPGSRVASEMLVDLGLQIYLDKLGFNVVGHGCMTCMGNSGPLDEAVEREIRDKDVAAAAVLSGNRNFEGRIHPLCRLAYLASPPLVVAYALAGTTRIELDSEPIGQDPEGSPVFVADLLPPDDEIDSTLAAFDIRHASGVNRSGWLKGDSAWEALAAPEQDKFPWEGSSGMIRRPPFLSVEATRPLFEADLAGIRALAVLGDNVTTDHISPVSRILPESEAGMWLKAQDVRDEDLGSFSSRRLNHDVMIRGGFANPKIRNRIVVGTEGGLTKVWPEGRTLPIHEAARIYRERDVPLIVVAGRNYGAGSARDWAAKVTRLLGVRAIVARSFERIHRTNLVAFGILPLELPAEFDCDIDGSETFALTDIAQGIRPDGWMQLVVTKSDGTVTRATVRARIDTSSEASWIACGGLFSKVLSEISS